MRLPYLLTLITFLPLVGAMTVALLPRTEKGLARGVSLGWSLLVFAASLPVAFGFDPQAVEMQFVDTLEWLPRYGIRYEVGVDGISLWLVMLTTFLTPIVLISAFRAVEERVREYMVCMLVLESGMLGALVSTDIFLFYVFWEVMLIPMYLLIGFWGSKRRVYAAVKFFLFTLVGSLLMLVAILYLYFQHAALTGVLTARLSDLASLALPAGGAGPALSRVEQVWLFAAFALAFAIKVPMFPFHTWLPDAHTEAPTGGSVILAGVLLKMGTYGFLRFAIPLFPQGTAFFLPAIAVLSVIGIIYGALVAMVQPDVKRLVAYSSVSHLGFVMLGIAGMTHAGLSGAILQMLNHGISTGALFLCIGILYERRHTREIEAFGGISKVMPGFAAVFMITTLASVGLPGLNGFVGEFLILAGTFKSKLLAGAWIYTVLAASGVILSAAYMLWMFQRVMFGPVRHEENRNLPDLTGREWLYMLPMVLLMFVMGLFPGLFLNPMEMGVRTLIGNYQRGLGMDRAALVEPADTDDRAAFVLPENGPFEIAAPMRHP